MTQFEKFKSEIAKTETPEELWDLLLDKDEEAMPLYGEGQYDNFEEAWVGFMKQEVKEDDR